MAKDAAAATAAWVAGMQNAGTKITAGVNAVTKAPGQSAAEAVDRWMAGVQASRNRYVTNSAAVTLQQWRDKTINVGIPRISAGVTANASKMQNFLTWFLPAQQAVTDQVRAMPKGTIDQAIARAAAQIRGTAALKRNA